MSHFDRIGQLTSHSLSYFHVSFPFSTPLKWTENKGELQHLVFWYNGGPSWFIFLPRSKIISYQEGNKAGLCKLSKTLKDSSVKKSLCLWGNKVSWSFWMIWKSANKIGLTSALWEPESFSFNLQESLLPKLRRGSMTNRIPRLAQRIKLQINPFMQRPRRKPSPMNFSSQKKIELSLQIS